MWAAKKIKTERKKKIKRLKSCDISHRGQVSLDADLLQQIQRQAALWMCCFCGRATILLPKGYLILSRQGCKIMLVVCMCVCMWKGFSLANIHGFLSVRADDTKQSKCTNLICYAAVWPCREREKERESTWALSPSSSAHPSVCLCLCCKWSLPHTGNIIGVAITVRPTCLYFN